MATDDTAAAPATPRAAAVARVDRYRRRRQLALATLVGLLVVLVLLVSRTAAPPTPPTAHAATPPATGTFGVTGSDPGTTDALAAAVAAAEQHRVATGSYRGVPTSLAAAANDDTVVLFVLPEGTSVCTYVAIDGGQVGDPRTDPSGRACAASARAQLQVALDAAGAGAASPDQPPALLQRAAAMAARAADYNLVDGVPSFLGIEQLPLQGITVRPGAEHTTMVLRTTTGPCFEATVATTGQLGPAARC